MAIAVERPTDRLPLSVWAKILKCKRAKERDWVSDVGFIVDVKGTLVRAHPIGVAPPDKSFLGLRRDKSLAASPSACSSRLPQRATPSGRRR